MRSVAHLDADSGAKGTGTGVERFGEQSVRAVGHLRGVPAVYPSVGAGRGRADYLAGQAVRAAEEPELHAGGIGSGGVQGGGCARNRRPVGGDEDRRGRRCVLLTVMLTPALKALALALNASETRVYEPLGTVVVFQLYTHP